jgi:hypothetical protein
MSALPHFSDVDLLGYGKRIIDFDSQVTNGTLDFRMAQQELNRSKIARFFVDESCFSPAKGMRAVEAWIKVDHCEPPF